MATCINRSMGTRPNDLETISREAGSATRKRIVELYPAANKVINVARHHGELVQQCIEKLFKAELMRMPVPPNHLSP